MNFTRSSANLTPIEDTVFTVVQMAKEDSLKNGAENVIDATIGSLSDEDGKLVAYPLVFKHYDEIDRRSKAAYASSFTGNPAYRREVFNWVSQGKIHLPHSVIATPGGSGAVSSCFMNLLDVGQTVLIPDIAWGSYQLMASQSNLSTQTYLMFDEKDEFNLADLKEKATDIMHRQHKVLVVINDPCHNPTGLSLGKQIWDELIDFFNELSKEGPCILLNDIAYIDYCHDLDHNHDYMESFNHIAENVSIIAAFSCSKTLTSYGLRCGAAVLLAKTEELVRQEEIVFEKTARAIWSNVPSAAMDNFAWIVSEAKTEFLQEKQGYIDLLKKRSDLFLKEAKRCGLRHYPYHEGFFITLKVYDNDHRNRLHQALIDYHIYTVKVNKGIRVAVCSLSIDKIKGLAQKIKEIDEALS